MKKMTQKEIIFDQEALDFMEASKKVQSLQSGARQEPRDPSRQDHSLAWANFATHIVDVEDQSEPNSEINEKSQTSYG